VSFVNKEVLVSNPCVSIVKFREQVFVPDNIALEGKHISKSKTFTTSQPPRMVNMLFNSCKKIKKILLIIDFF